MNTSTSTQTRFLYSEAKGMPVTNKLRLFYNPYTVAYHLQKDKELPLNPEDIEAIEEWAHVLLVKFKNRKPRFVSKKQIRENFSWMAAGRTYINLAPRVQVRVEANEETFIVYLGYHNREMAWQASRHLKRKGVATAAPVNQARCVVDGEWELMAKGMSQEVAFYFASKDLCDRSRQQALVLMSDEEIQVLAAQAKADLGI